MGSERGIRDRVCRETKTMQRHVEHHLARARAVGRRASGHARAEVWPSAESVLRAVTRIYEETRFDLDGNRDAAVSRAVSYPHPTLPTFPSVYISLAAVSATNNI